MAEKKKPKPRHVPRRTCVGCREVLPKRGLIRIVRSPEGVKIDLSGKLPGRGAYLHDQKSCWLKGLKGPLAKALRVAIPEQDQAMLHEFIQGLPDAETQTAVPDNKDSMMA
ncbi:MAG: YlxR family protein [Chloroflexi bacterium]|nr:YlxR family protein [Chloroflexota bacterium]